MELDAVIQKLYIEVNSDDQTVDPQQADEVMRLIKQQVLPKLEEVLEDYFQSNEATVRLGRLQIDLGQIDPNDLAVSLTRSLQQSVPKAVSEALEDAATDQRHQERIANDEAADTTALLSNRNTELTLHFLAQGTMPWWAGKHEHVDALRAQWETLFNAPKAPETLAEVQALVQGIKASATAQKRLLYQFGAPFIEKMLSIIQREQAMHWASMSSTTVEALLPVDLRTQWLLHALAFLLQPPSPSIPVEPSAMLAHILRQLGHEASAKFCEKQHEEVVVEVLIEKVLQQYPTLLDFNQSTSITENKTEETQSESTNASAKLAETTKHHEAAAEQEITDRLLRKLFRLDDDTSVESEGASEAIYIQNAGLALLAPFFPHLLSEMGLLRFKQFVAEEHRMQSVYILHYLATGQLTANEDELYFPKVLCNWPQEEPLPPFEITVDDALKAAEEQLWEAVRYRWKSMSKSKAGALQYNFLQRDGKLEQDHAGHWTLTVEKDGRDVMLQFVEWSYQILRFPWMSEIIYVEWGS